MNRQHLPSIHQPLLERLNDRDTLTTGKRAELACFPGASLFYKRSLAGNFQLGNALPGFACDAGVARNHGRSQATEWPAALRTALAEAAELNPLFDIDSHTAQHGWRLVIEAD